MPTATITVTATQSEEFKTDDGLTIEFPKGLLGFEDYRRFRLTEPPDVRPFVRLQSLDDEELSFVVVNPRVFFPHYKVEVDPREIAELNSDDPAQIETWVIVTVPEDWSRISANLQGPVLVNRANGLAKQVVLVHGPYTTRHYLMDELQKQKGPSVVHASKREQAVSV
jgi:flagellar assembly factor FliW